MTVNHYEIELKIRLPHRNTMESGPNERIVTRTEYAYDVGDALKQVCYNIVKDLKPGETLEQILSIGPPAELIRASAYAVTRAIEEAMQAIAGRK